MKYHVATILNAVLSGQLVPATPPANDAARDEQLTENLLDELRELRNFLGGTRPLENVWFGDDHPTKPGRFWWREHLSRIDRLTVETAAAMGGSNG